MAANLRLPNPRSLLGMARKVLFAILLAAGVATVLQPVTADARDFGGGGHGEGGHGWGGHGEGGGHEWGGHERGEHGWGGPEWSFGFYAPLYAWDPYPYPYYYEPRPYYYGAPDYYDPPLAPVAARPAYDAYAWPESARAYHEQAYEEALSAPIGETIAWSGGGIKGTVTSVRDGHSGDRYCREFVQKVVIDGRPQQAYGAACQTPDGSWQIVPDNP